jgi:hypothetical protein
MKKQNYKKNKKSSLSLPPSTCQIKHYPPPPSPSTIKKRKRKNQPAH